MFLKRLAATLHTAKVKFAVGGGYAVALHGAVRGTVDIDLVIVLERTQFQAMEQALNGLGLVSLLPVTAEEVFDFRKEYIANRNLITWSFHNPNAPLEVVDIIITHNVEVMELVSMQLGDIQLPVVSKQELINMKLAASRPQDIVDVAALKRLL